MKKDCWNCKNDNQNAKFPCDYCHTGNTDDFWKPKDEMKDFAIAELEEIKAEIIKRKCKYCDIDANIQKCLEEHNSLCDVDDILVIIDKRIAELKGE